MQDPRSHTCCFSGYRPEKMPFRTYDPDAVQALEAALDRAVEYAVSQGYHTFFSGCFSVRNRFMVDSSSLLICYFDGQAGGTAQTVHYAQSSGLHIINLSPRTYDQLSLL